MQERLQRIQGTCVRHNFKRILLLFPIGMLVICAACWSCIDSRDSVTKKEFSPSLEDVTVIEGVGIRDACEFQMNLREIGRRFDRLSKGKYLEGSDGMMRYYNSSRYPVSIRTVGKGDPPETIIFHVVKGAYDSEFGGLETYEPFRGRTGRGLNFASGVVTLADVTKVYGDPMHRFTQGRDSLSREHAMCIKQGMPYLLEFPADKRVYLSYGKDGIWFGLDAGVVAVVGIVCKRDGAMSKAEGHPPGDARIEPDARDE